MPDIFLELQMPPSLNTLYPTVGNRRALSKAGKAWYAKSLYSIRSQWNKVGFNKQRVMITIWLTFQDNRRRDIDNVIKPILDCITKSGIWKDDSQVDELRVIRCHYNNTPASAKMMIKTISIYPTSDST